MRLTEADRHYLREGREIERKMAKAPTTGKVAGILREFAEAQPPGELHDAFSLFAGRVEEWHRDGYEVKAEDVANVLEAFAMNLRIHGIGRRP